MDQEHASRRRTRHGLLLLAAIALVALAWLKPLDSTAETHVRAGLARALATFAVARTINGIVSVAQETGVAVQPGGVGMTFAPGQLLDPINDLVEQVSSVMLAVSVSFGIQLLLLHLGGSMLVSALLTAAVLAFGALWWRRAPMPRWTWRLLAAIIFVRFAVPLATSGSELAYQYAMAGEYASRRDWTRRSSTSCAWWRSSPFRRCCCRCCSSGCWAGCFQRCLCRGGSSEVPATAETIARAASIRLLWT
jgi:hypothetical protein